MLDNEIDALVGWMSRVFKPRNHDKKLLEAVLLTWDTEYKLPYDFPKPEEYERKYGTPYPIEHEQIFRPEKPFLTHQLAARLSDGTIVAKGVKADRPWSRKEFIHWTHGCLDKWGIRWRGKRIIIGTHFSRMELQHIHPLPKLKEWGDSSWEAWLSPNILVIDTGKLFGGVSLAKVTAGSPIEKHHLDGFKDKPEQH